MNELDRINTQTTELRKETERLAKRNDGVYYVIAFVIAIIALAMALFM